MTVSFKVLGLVFGTAVVVSCASGNEDAQVVMRDQDTCLHFQATPLVPTMAQASLTEEWSANDDKDSLSIAISGDGSSSRGLLRLEAGKRPLRLADDLVDTTVVFVRIGEHAVTEAPSGTDEPQERLLLVLRPTELDSLAGVTGDERVVALRGRFSVGEAVRCVGQIRILPAM